MVGVEQTYDSRRQLSGDDCCADVVGDWWPSFQRRLQCFVEAPLEEEQGMMVE